LALQTREVGRPAQNNGSHALNSVNTEMRPFVNNCKVTHFVWNFRQREGYPGPSTVKTLQRILLRGKKKRQSRW
jgi:hypothetical protein